LDDSQGVEGMMVADWSRAPAQNLILNTEAQQFIYIIIPVLN